MKIWTFIIGSMDDFESLEDMMQWVDVVGWDGDKNYSCFEFDAPEDCSKELIISIGRGYAFDADWCADGTFSFIVPGSINKTTQKLQTETQRHDLWEL
jgi:hypothetical protein